MALMETKIVQVRNSAYAVNQQNEIRGSFGWNVLSVQITHTRDTRTYTSGLDVLTGDATVETTTIEYATITYQRDKAIANRDQLINLECKYDNLCSEISALSTTQPLNLIVIAFLVTLWPLGIWYLVKKSKEKPIKQAKIKECEEEMKTILAQAVKLL